MDPPFTAFGTTARDEFARHRTAVGKRAREAAMRRALNSRARVVGTGRRDRRYVGRRTRASALRRRTLTGGARGGGGGGGVGGRCVDDAANAFDADSQLTSDITRVSIHPERTQRRGRRRGGAVARRGSARRVGRFVTRVRYTTKTATRRVRGGRARHSHRVRSPVALGVLRGAEGAAHVFFATGAGKPERASSLPVGLINGHELRTLSARRESSAGRRAVAVSLPRAPRARRRGGEGARGHRRGESSHQPRTRHGRHVRRRRRQRGFRVRRRGGAGASD
mmetsp:Transcript_8647/g.28882  ORF Transcript_8647/g.28882 Transcript_8647/m.28882 type:complete len:280 (-) Transcript_8647:1652-2491(-)